MLGCIAFVFVVDVLCVRWAGLCVLLFCSIVCLLVCCVFVFFDVSQVGGFLCVVFVFVCSFVFRFACLFVSCVILFLLLCCCLSVCSVCVVCVFVWGVLLV